MRIMSSPHPIVARLERMGYHAVRLPEPDCVGGSGLRIVRWPRQSGRAVIVSGPYATRRRRGRIVPERGVWMHQEFLQQQYPVGWWRWGFGGALLELWEALDRAVARQALRAGGLAPYRRAYPKRPYPGDPYAMAVVLWEWARAGVVESKLTEHRSGPLLREVPKYVHDGCVCQWCGREVSCGSLARHQRSTRCQQTLMHRLRMCSVLALHPSSEEMRLWARQVVERLSSLGVDATYRCMGVSESGSPMRPGPTRSYLGMAYVVWVPRDQLRWADALVQAAGVDRRLLGWEEAEKLVKRLADPQTYLLAVGESLLPDEGSDVR